MNLRAFILVLFILPLQCFGHSLSDSYIEMYLEDTRVSGHWQIAVSDLELALGLDRNLDSQISWGELQDRQSAIYAYANSHMQIERGGEACDYSFDSIELSDLNAGMFLYLPFQGQCVSSGATTLHYDLLFDIDSTHRGIATIYENERVHSLLFSPQHASATVEQNSASLMTHMKNFLVEGVWHIWIGLDHILFLVALLVAIVFGDRRAHMQTHRYGDTLGELIKVISAFTLAHSITLILASLQIVSLPARFVETLIALSVAVSGFNIIVPIFHGRHWQIAFGFGLIHGFGFAGVLSDLSLPTAQYISGLLSFNIGVEVGQLAIVLILVPFLFLLSAPKPMRVITSTCAGLCITTFGVLWVAERSVM